MSDSIGNPLSLDRIVVAAYSYAHAILGDPNLALQATQAALGRTRSPGSNAHWVELFDATRRAALSLRRSAQHGRAEASIVGRLANASGTSDAVPVDAAALTAAFASLPQPDRETIAAALVGGRNDTESLARALNALITNLTELTLPADEDIPGDYDAR